MRLPRHFRELPIYIFLIEARPRAQPYVVAEDLVVEQTGGDDQCRAVPGGVVQLPRRLSGPRDDMEIHECRLPRDLMITIGHRDHDSFMQAHDQLHPWLAQEGIEKTDLKGARIGKQIAHARSFHLGDHEFAACSRELPRAGSRALGHGLGGLTDRTDSGSGDSQSRE